MILRLFHVRRRKGFTLLEVLMAVSACAILLIAVYNIFGRAVRLRDDATLRIRESRVTARAAAVIRDDLRNALVSGGILAASLEGSREGRGSQFPGYLKFTTTSQGAESDEPAGDVQQVEYFVVTDPAAVSRTAGLLVRAVERNLLAPVREEAAEMPLLTGVSALEITFFDGQSWRDSWAVTETEKTLPQAVRVIIQRAAAERTETAPSPIEVLIPWSTQAAVEAGGE